MTGERRATVTNTAKRRRAGKIPEWRVEDFQAIVSKNADAMIVLDHEGYVLYVNPAAESLFNLPSAEMVGLYFGFPIILDEPVEMYILREFKDFVAAEVRLAEVMWAGEMSYLLSFRDLTDRIAAEQAMGQARDKLDAMVNERTRELSDANELLKREIAERKQADEALQESEAMLRQIIDTSPIPLVVYREEKNYRINKKFIEAFGYTMEDIPSIDEWWPLAYPDKAYREFVKNRWYAAVDDAVKNKTSIAPQEVTVACKDGSKKDVLAFFSSIGDMNLAILQDITERKRAEEAIIRSEQMLQLVMDNIPQAIFWKDRNSTYLGCNKVLARAAGLGTPRDIRGKTDYDLPWSREQADFFRGYDRKVMENDRPEYHIVEQLREASGRLAWVETNKVPLHDAKGNVTGILGTYEDITERKRAEEALRESEARFRQLSESLPQLVWTCRADGPCDYLSPQWVKYTGIPEDVQLGYGWLDQVHPDDRERVAREWASTTIHGEPFNIEFRIRRHDGVYRWFKTRAMPIRDSANNLVKWFGSNTDIDEMKRAEEELVNAKAQAELYLDLMGHDINNLHQVALGYLELARDTPAGEEQAMFLDKPIEVLQRSAMLIGNVRKLQKLHDGVFKTELVDVCKLLVNVQREFGGVPHKQVTLNLNGRERCLVWANELLHDVFSNLVGNAIKHTGDRADIVVDMDVVNEKSGRYCRVIVEDDGPGIRDDFKGVIFNRMLKGTGTAKGMGLGLYLVKSLVDSYGGRVRVEDRIMGDHTKGARFVVMLPAIEK